MNLQILGPLLLALLAAIGNGFFAYSQRSASGVDNSFVFITITLMVCIFACILAAPLFGPVNYLQTIRNNINWGIIGGLGLFLTYIGFNLLYSKYGAANYILYAVLSIITTTVIVGGIVLKENLNMYHWLAVITALITVGLYSYGNKIA